MTTEQAIDIAVKQSQGKHVFMVGEVACHPDYQKSFKIESINSDGTATCNNTDFVVVLKLSELFCYKDFKKLVMDLYYFG
jgi:hypothetical protein